MVSGVVLPFAAAGLPDARRPRNPEAGSRKSVRTLRRWEWVPNVDVREYDTARGGPRWHGRGRRHRWRQHRRPAGPVAAHVVARAHRVTGPLPPAGRRAHDHRGDAIARFAAAGTASPGDEVAPVYDVIRERIGAARGRATADRQPPAAARRPAPPRRRARGDRAIASRPRRRPRRRRGLRLGQRGRVPAPHRRLRVVPEAVHEVAGRDVARPARGGTGCAPSRAPSSASLLIPLAVGPVHRCR